eukprot:GHVQ01022540.1.p2 GENE.GHVQ01022540.1~~GHVQ01022540.1.p2  ORF type:complete len:272 (+),score=44.56 GHVQ01022540.1:269-1084(+)
MTLSSSTHLTSRVVNLTRSFVPSACLLPSLSRSLSCSSVKSHVPTSDGSLVVGGQHHQCSMVSVGCNYVLVGSGGLKQQHEQQKQQQRQLQQHHQQNRFMTSVRRTASWSEPVRYNSDMCGRIDRLNDTILSANWEDYFQLVQNMTLWDAERDLIDSAVVPFLHDSQVKEQHEQLQKTMDVLYALSDVRDHLNELADYCSRTAGVAGTGAYAVPPVDNIDEHIDALTNRYEELKSLYVDYLPQIESVLGSGLAMLCQKIKFRWSTMHQFHF